MLEKQHYFWSRRCLILAFVASQAFLFNLRAENLQQVVPTPGWEDDYDPIASPDAVIGGEISVGFGPYPSSFNYFLDLSAQAAAILDLMYDNLLEVDPITLKFVPKIARKIEMSEDKKTFVIHVDPRAKWSDGKPITAADFQFTFDTIMDEKNLVAGVFKAAFSKFSRPELIDEHTFKMVTSEVNWRNLVTIGDTPVLPKHAFEGKDFNQVKFEFPVVSGRYKIGELKESVSLTLERRSDWWGEDLKRFQGIQNFGKIRLKFYPELEMQFDAFNNQDIDYYEVYTSRIWKAETDGDRYAKNWIVKQAVYNSEPSAFSGLCMNMRLDLYKDIRVRKALAYLFDRRRMNETLMYNAYEMIRSYSGHLYDESHPNPNESIEFNVDKARALLADAGWKANPDTGILEKDGKQFVINFLIRSSTSEKFLAIYAESLKDVGIELNIIKKDWAAWIEDMDQLNFEMTWPAWRPALFDSPEQLWDSKQADRKASSNYSGLKDPRVDALIEEHKRTFDVERRREIDREVDQIVYNHHPYVLTWGINFKRLLRWNKFGTPDTVLNKFEDADKALTYWWADPDLEAELEEAMEAGAPLPPQPSEVHFDEAFQSY